MRYHGPLIDMNRLKINFSYWANHHLLIRRSTKFDLPDHVPLLSVHFSAKDRTDKFPQLSFFSNITSKKSLSTVSLLAKTVSSQSRIILEI